MRRKDKHSILSTLIADSSEVNGRLSRTCEAPLDSFFKAKDGWVIKDKNPMATSYWHERHAFKDNNASILAVAHCDTVLEGSYKYLFDPKELKAWSPELDDRLGVYLITSLLPRLGVQCDVLLTENEEMCSSTAKDFETDKKYNWIFEWDRRGSGVVMYQYETEETKELMQRFDFKVESGTYSDIADLHGLEVTGFNFATGYTNEHTKNCYADLRCLTKQVVKFLRFYNEYKDTRLESKAGPRYSTRYLGRGWSVDDYYDDSRYSGYIDRDGKWHSYAWSTTAASAKSGYKPVVKQDFMVCTSCNTKSKLKTNWLIRGKYICPTCEHWCRSCKVYYSYKQIDSATGFCHRCKALVDAFAQVSAEFKNCTTCKERKGCAEVWTDTWVCYDCLYAFFTTCDECYGVMPALNASSPKFPAVGICKVCADTIKPKPGLYEKCDGCEVKYNISELTHFPDEQLTLCPDCAEALMNDIDDDGDSPNYVVDREGNAVPSETSCGYDHCDICGMRDELFDFDDLQICNICRQRMSIPGL